MNCQMSANLGSVDPQARSFPPSWRDAAIRALYDQPMYVFSWDEIPEKDNARLIQFLTNRFQIELTKTAKIEKIDNSKTIRVFTEKNSLSLKLNHGKTEVILEIDDGRTNKFIAKKGDDGLDVYQLVNGVGCPNCFSEFRGLKQLRMLHGDHIIPYSLGGPTTWENLQLLCKGCNLAKYNHILDDQKISGLI